MCIYTYSSQKYLESLYNVISLYNTRIYGYEVIRLIHAHIIYQKKHFCKNEVNCQSIYSRKNINIFKVYSSRIDQLIYKRHDFSVRIDVTKAQCHQNIHEQESFFNFNNYLMIFFHILSFIIFFTFFVNKMSINISTLQCRQ
jgi:hypothetical protein